MLIGGIAGKKKKKRWRSYREISGDLGNPAAGALYIFIYTHGWDLIRLSVCGYS